MNKHQRLWGLYAITDPTLTPPDLLAEKTEAALAGGARIIQYRDKSTDSERRYREASELKSLCLQYNATLIINDDVALTARVQADGVHLGLTDTGIHEARQQLGPEFIIGATCHGEITNAHRAQQDGADYVAFGRFFPSRTKPDAPLARLDD
ncbi:MAG: thiamine phosphate synthase, partial [Ketobacteraceae bacterium]|nr:thiamine phosphate synthase [Ketobacteraceae bacterium]